MKMLSFAPCYVRCLVLILLTCLPFRSALAYEVGTTLTGKQIMWSTGKMDYVINTTGGPSGSSEAIQAGASTWTSVSTTSFSFVYQGSSASTSYGVNDGINLISFGSLSSPSTIAQNNYWYSVTTGALADSDIRFNTANFTFATDGSSSTMDVQDIMTHELGHSLNLQDLYTASDTEKTMYGYSSTGETKKRTLEQDDKDGITYLYPGTKAETLKADFSASPVTGKAPLQVTFSDASTGSITGWSWDFGDGSTSTQQNPVHKFSASGSYTVKLTVSGSAGSNTMTRDNYINVNSINLDMWKSYFAVDPSETPMVGDFNGDGKTDIITFTRDNASAVGDVYVALSEGNKFGNSDKWNDWFAVDQTQTIVIGDFNGDGMSDIGSWLGQSTREVYVSTSYGTGMNATGPAWLSSIGTGSDDVIKSGDVNGDGLDDIVLFARGRGVVYVAISNGSGFESPAIRHDFFAVSTYERPEVGDVDGDGKADIITFATDSPTAQGDVFVSLSTGSKFGDGRSSAKWNDWFAVDSSQRVRIGDINGDGRADFATFLQEPNNQVYAVYSQGNGMSDNYLITSGFSNAATDQVFLGDFNGDHKADIILFRQSEGNVYVILTQ